MDLSAETDFSVSELDINWLRCLGRAVPYMHGSARNPNRRAAIMDVVLFN